MHVCPSIPQVHVKIRGGLHLQCLCSVDGQHFSAFVARCHSSPVKRKSDLDIARHGSRTKAAVSVSLQLSLLDLMPLTESQVLMMRPREHHQNVPEQQGIVPQLRLNEGQERKKECSEIDRASVMTFGRFSHQQSTRCYHQHNLESVRSGLSLFLFRPGKGDKIPSQAEDGRMPNNTVKSLDFTTQSRESSR